MAFRTVALVLFVVLSGLAQPALAPTSSAHSKLHDSRFVVVDRDVRLEVLDWGGAGRTVVFLPGLGNTAHVYDEFAPRFTDKYKVIGVTRRGFGASSRPSGGYGAARLASDAVAILKALDVKRPVLVGHSFAGEELSYVAAQNAVEIGGLVYLDAAYDRTGIDIKALWKQWPQASQPTRSERATRAAYQEFSRRTHGYALPEFDLEQYDRFGDPPADVPRAMMEGVLPPDYRRITAPSLGIYAVPKSVEHLFPSYKVLGSDVQRLATAFWPKLAAQVERQLDRFRREVRRGTAVTLSGATHYMFLSDADETERQMRAFLETL